MSALEAASRFQEFGLQRAMVLVADDDEAMREILSHVLRQEGYEVLTAANGRSALDIARRTRPAVVITDALMPLLDGRELCRRIKEEAPGTRVVLMTSLYRTARQRNEAFDVFRVDGFLPRPLDLSSLLCIVNSLLEEAV